ncbi:MAG: hypothetical protein M1514_01365 [Patescibacteria group bacterium]|nr:hypothetical protein [Patescibacteria group bacterium]
MIIEIIVAGRNYKHQFCDAIIRPRILCYEDEFKDACWMPIEEAKILAKEGNILKALEKIDTI